MPLSFSLRFELSLVRVRSEYDYNTQEFQDGIGLIRERLEGVFLQERTSLRAPLTALWTFGKGLIKPSILAGIFIHGKGVGSGEWKFTERQYASIENELITVYDPPRLLTGLETFRFPGKIYLGLVMGGNLILDLPGNFDILLDARYERGFNQENRLIPYKRFGYSIAIGLVIDISKKPKNTDTKNS